MVILTKLNYEEENITLAHDRPQEIKYSVFCNVNPYVLTVLLTSHNL